MSNFWELEASIEGGTWLRIQACLGCGISSLCGCKYIDLQLLNGSLQIVFECIIIFLLHLNGSTWILGAFLAIKCIGLFWFRFTGLSLRQPI